MQEGMHTNNDKLQQAAQDEIPMSYRVLRNEFQKRRP